MDETRSKCDGRCPFTEAALLLHEGCLKEECAPDPSNQDPTQEWLPYTEGLTASWIKSEQNQSWCYSSLGRLAITREASKNGCLTWHQGF